MKQLILASGLALVGLGGVALAAGAGKTWDFQGDPVGAAPAGFSFGHTGQGGPGKWEVRLDPTAPSGDHVLAQVEGDGTDNHFRVAVADAPLLKDVRVDVKCKPVAGKVDQACGLVVRYRNAGRFDHLLRGTATPADSITYYDAHTVTPLP